MAIAGGQRIQYVYSHLSHLRKRQTTLRGTYCISVSFLQLVHWGRRNYTVCCGWFAVSIAKCAHVIIQRCLVDYILCINTNCYYMAFFCLSKHWLKEYSNMIGWRKNKIFKSNWREY